MQTYMHSPSLISLYECDAYGIWYWQRQESYKTPFSLFGFISTDWRYKSLMNRKKCSSWLCFQTKSCLSLCCTSLVPGQWLSSLVTWNNARACCSSVGKKSFTTMLSLCASFHREKLWSEARLFVKGYQKDTVVLCLPRF
jgi:hypothetical protein